MALMKRANREINVPENLVAEYLDKGYSVIDSNGMVLQASNPQTIEDFRGLVTALKAKISSLEAEKASAVEDYMAVLKSNECLKKQIEEINVQTSTDNSSEAKKPESKKSRE